MIIIAKIDLKLRGKIDNSKHLAYLAKQTTKQKYSSGANTFPYLDFSKILSYQFLIIQFWSVQNCFGLTKLNWSDQIDLDLTKMKWSPPK